MTLPRKDVRFKLDNDMHEALSILAEMDNVNFDKWVEAVICRAIRNRVSAANMLARRVERLSLSGNGGGEVIDFQSSES